MPKTSCSAKRRESNVSSTSQYPSTTDTTPHKIPPLQNVTFFGKDFMDSLLNFMQHSHSFLQNWRQEVGGLKQYMMTNEERQMRLQELMSLIAVKERELAELEAQRAQLNATPNESYANYSSGVERFSSQRKELPQQPYQYPVNEYQEESYVIENADTQYPISDDYISYTSQQYSQQLPSLGCRPRTPTYESDGYEGAEIVDDRYYNETPLVNPNN